MDDVGFKTWTEDGRPQVHNSFITWGLTQTGTGTLYDDGQLHPSPIVVGNIIVTANAPILAIRPIYNPNSGPYGPSVGLVYSSKVGNTFTFHFLAQSNVPVSFDWWVFDNADAAMIDASMDDVGGRVYNIYGQKTFDASMSMLRPVTWVAPAGDEVVAYPIPAGKSYAVAFTGMAHHVSQLDTGLYSDSVEKPPPSLPEEGNPGTPGPNMRWRQQDVFNGMGMVSAQENYLYLGMTAIEEYRDWFIGGSNPFDRYSGQMGFSVIDVTDFAGGGGTIPGGFTVNVNSTLREVSISGAGDSVTPAVTLSIVGGSGTPVITWLKRFGGSDEVIANGATDQTTFNTKVIGQPASSVREAYWYARVVKGGVTAYSPDVLFRHTTSGPDTTPDTIAPFDRFDQSSNNNDEQWYGPYRKITGINQNITLRVERYDYVGNLSGLYFDVYTAPDTSGPWTLHGTVNAHTPGLQVVDFSVPNNTWFTYNARAVTTNGRRTGNCTMTVWNLSAPGGSVKISDVTNNNFIIDADDNYNNADYVPNALDWNNISGSTNDSGLVSGHANQTISGINQPITLRATLSNVSAVNVVTASRLDFWKNGAYAHDTSGIGNGYWTEASFVSGDYGGFIAHIAAATVGVGTLSYTVTVTNQSDNGTVLDTFTVNQTVYANYVPADYTPNPITLTNQNVVTDEWEGYTPGTYFQITGINQPITIRVSRGTTTDSQNIFTRRQIIGHSTNGGASYVETNMGALSAPLDFTANNGDWFFIKGYFNTNAGRGGASWTTTVVNATTGVTLGSCVVSGTVDDDNNYNVPDYTMTMPSLSYPDLVTNDPSGYTNTPAFQVTGINQPVNLRFTRAGLSLTGNIIYGRQYIGHSTNGGASWTSYLLTAAAGAEVNFTVNNGDYVSYYGYVETSGGRATASWYTEITNTTAGQYLGYFYVNGVVDDDHNFNVGPALAVSLDNTYVWNSEFRGSGEWYSASAYNQVHVTVSGGTGNYTLTWERTSATGVDYNWSVSGTTVPSWSYFGYTSYAESAVYRLKVTDGVSTIYSNYVTVELAAGDIA